jgi:hypothetical protein
VLPRVNSRIEGRWGWVAGLAVVMLAGAAAFGVPPSYLLDRSRNPLVLDEEVLEALANKSSAAIPRESARLSERDKEIVLRIVRQFGSQIDDA